jgi:protease YdgD
MKVASKWALAVFVFALSACAKNNFEQTAGVAASKTDSKAIFLDNKGKDRRVPMLNKDYPWSTIGRLYRDLGNNMIDVCTGTLVGRSIVLTAAHCVLQDGKIVGVVFQASYNKGAFTAQADSTNITVGTTDPETYQAADWAVIHLNSPLGDQFGYMGTQNIGVLSSIIPVAYSGYSDNFQQTEVAGVASCFIRGNRRDGTYGHDCSMGPGGSGGPLFTEDRTGQSHILAVNTRGIYGGVYSSFSPEVANIAVMSQVLVNTVIQYRNQYDR